ncbi:MAG: hypothetical protein JRJ66_13865 [Deltaproteobacteria bacterium]|nr:hypothetical protein [Deltaproteobacteria bacterium]
MKEKQIGFLKKFMALACHYCPVCIYGRKKPQSLAGKLLHHRLHAEHCPFWKAEKAVYDED